MEGDLEKEETTNSLGCYCKCAYQAEGSDSGMYTGEPPEVVSAEAINAFHSPRKMAWLLLKYFSPWLPCHAYCLLPSTKFLFNELPANN